MTNIWEVYSLYLQGPILWLTNTYNLAKDIFELKVRIKIAINTAVLQRNTLTWKVANTLNNQKHSINNTIAQNVLHRGLEHQEMDSTTWLLDFFQSGCMLLIHSALLWLLLLCRYLNEELWKRSIRTFS